MATFYFDVHDVRGLHPDRIGQDLPDLDAVRTEAMHALPEIAFSIAEDGDRQSIVVIARDDQKRAVYSATLAYTGEWLTPHGATASD